MAGPRIQRFKHELTELKVTKLKDRVGLQNRLLHLEEKSLLGLTAIIHDITHICFRQVSDLRLGLLISIH
jgi:hypothetical protein